MEKENKIREVMEKQRGGWSEHWDTMAGNYKLTLECLEDAQTQLLKAVIEVGEEMVYNPEKLRERYKKGEIAEEGYQYTTGGNAKIWAFIQTLEQAINKD